MRALTSREFYDVRGGQTAGSGGTPAPTTTTTTTTTSSSFSVGVHVGAGGSIDGVSITYRYAEGGSPPGGASTSTSGPNDGIVRMDVEEINVPARKGQQAGPAEDLEGLY
jgi:hypothetical protein